MAEYACDGAVDDVRRARLVALLVPYFEGYSVTARALSMDLDSVSEMLTDMAPGACNGR
ncbi:MAG: hypothetical protein HRU31_06835 [Rhodobacteraceae bacterium]|nr:hypothetical protein [Paracoccaceae bacterium]